MFKNKIILYAFIITLCLGILFLSASKFFINPSFTRLLIEGFENQAVNLAMHLSESYLPHNMPLSGENVDRIAEYAGSHMKDFGLMKLKIFAPEGEVIFSTDQKDVGTINQMGYYQEIAATGRPFTQVVEKDALSLEGERVAVNMLKTHVPLMSGGKFNGAFEIYYDITNSYSKLNSVVHKSWITHLIMTAGGLIITFIVLFKLDNTLSRQKKIEEEVKVYAEKLRKSNRELQDFAHIASHDLQEPLRKVTAFGERLRTRYGDALDDQGRDYLDRMENAASRMRNLIQGLLSYSRVTTKAKPFEPVDLSVVAQGVLSDLEMRIQETGGNVEMGDLPKLKADPLQMQQLFQNLIGNALKFHKKDQQPCIKVSAESFHSNGKKPLKEKYYRITFEDNGIGFDQQYEERIFGVFQRLHGRQEFEGSGIGLSVCKKITERHGGNISAESTPGEGAKFIVTLPENQSDGGNHG